MNFVKRAGLSLLARKGRALIMFGLFSVICTLVLGGFLVQRAADAAASSAKQQVGTEATLKWDEEKAFKDGGFTGSLPENARLSTAKADKLGTSNLISGYNYVLENATVPEKLKPASNVPPPAGLPEDMRNDRMLPLIGTRELNGLRDFRDGHHTITSGRGITASDAGKDVIVIEGRLAASNGLKVGDKVTLGSASGKNPRSFEVVGVYVDPTQSPKGWVSPQSEPGNKIYAPLDAIGRLDPEEQLGGGMRIHEAVYTLKDPESLDEFRKQAGDAGLDMKVFGLSINDKQYKQLVGPIQNVASFAGVTAWLVGIAGAAIVGLLIALWMRERRRELGILLAMGEKRWRLVAQQIVEVVAVAVLALGFSAAVGQALSQNVGSSLLGKEVAAVEPGAPVVPGRTGPQEQTVAPIDRLEIRLQSGDVLKVGLVGLGIALFSVGVPAGRILRMHPRTILTKGE